MVIPWVRSGRNTPQAMGEGNLETVRRALETYNRQDRDAWLSMHDPDYEFRADPEWPESGTVRGREAAWDFIATLVEAWDDEDDFEMVEAIECGDDKIVARYRRAVRGRASGIADVLDYWAINTLRGGLIIRMEWFASRDRAFEAAGMAP